MARCAASWVPVLNPLPSVRFALGAGVSVGGGSGAQYASRCRVGSRDLFRAVSTSSPPPFKFPVDVKTLSDRDRERLRLYSKSIPLVATHEPLDVLYEDEELLCVNKPDFIKMHPAHRFEGGTLLNRAIAHVGPDKHVHVLHRLDMHTTGVVIFAKCAKISKAMHLFFRDRQIRKEYLAVVDGVEIPSASTSAGATGGRDSATFHVDAAIQRTAWHKFAREVGNAPDAKSAQTTFRVLDSTAACDTSDAAEPGPSGHSLLHCIIHTGRTHQIRVHSAYSSLPIVGDSLYNPAERVLYPDIESLQAAAHDRNAVKYAFDQPLRAGLKLHAWRLSFPDPRSGVLRRFCAPPTNHFLQFCHHANLEIPNPDAQLLR